MANLFLSINLYNLPCLEREHMLCSIYLILYPDDGLNADGGPMAQIPSYVTTVPDGTEKACPLCSYW